MDDMADRMAAIVGKDCTWAALVQK
jgi:hypothetical protein